MKKITMIAAACLAFGMYSCMSDPASSSDAEGTDSTQTMEDSTAEGSDEGAMEMDSASAHETEEAADVDQRSAEIHHEVSAEVKDAHMMEGQEIEDEDEIVITMAMADQKPAMPGCEEIVEPADQRACFDEQLAAHIQDEFTYPERDLQQRTMLENNRERGVVEVYFEINELGLIERAKVVRSVNDELDAEALRVIESLPPMEPARANGRAVQVRYVVPISVNLN
ncbi:TonB family protein [Cryomorphaceae bacterium]|nr:TonB family protein [Cryomorphaceae bacterium]